MGTRLWRPSETVKRLVVALGAVLLVCSGAVLGHEGATGIVKQRMDEMKDIGRSLKRIGDRLRSKRDLATIATDANVIAAAVTRMPSLFPPESCGGHSVTSAAIWERWRSSWQHQAL